MTKLIDSHAHLDMPDLNSNIEEVLKLAEEAGVYKIIIPGVCVEDMPRIIELIDKYGHLYGAASVHPQDVDRWNDQSYKQLNEYLKHPKMVAVGETGLDYYWVKDNKDLQKHVFEEHIKLAKENQLPLIVHSREAHADTYEMVKQASLEGTKGVMHCFSGSPELALEYTKIGYYIGLGGPVTFKNAKKPKEVALKVPLESLLVETDSPYLTPHPHRGKKPNQPHYVKLVAEEIARIKNLPFEKVADQTTSNSLNLFNIINKQVKQISG